MKNNQQPTLSADGTKPAETASTTKYYGIMTICYLMWGFQPLYFNIYSGIDSLFLLMSRITWACIFSVLWIVIRGRGPEIIAIFRNRELMWKHLIPAAVFDFLDLAIYLWAVTSGHIIAVSLGYYVAPLVVCLIGVLIFREKLTWQLIAAFAIILIGIVAAGSGFGSAPLVSIALMFCFSIYAALMKNVKEDSVICTTVQMILMLPFALGTILLVRTGDNGLASVDLPMLSYLMMAGIIMVVPIMIYATCVKHLPMVVMGFFQYLSPTFGLVCSFILGEQMKAGEIKILMAIWAGVLLYTIVTALQARKQAKEQTS